MASMPWERPQGGFWSGDRVAQLGGLISGLGQGLASQRPGESVMGAASRGIGIGAAEYRAAGERGKDRRWQEYLENQAIDKTLPPGKRKFYQDLAAGGFSRGESIGFILEQGRHERPISNAQRTQIEATEAQTQANIDAQIAAAKERRKQTVADADPKGVVAQGRLQQFENKALRGKAVDRASDPTGTRAEMIEMLVMGQGPQFDIASEYLQRTEGLSREQIDSGWTNPDTGKRRDKYVIPIQLLNALEIYRKMNAQDRLLEGIMAGSGPYTANPPRLVDTNQQKLIPE